jgi:chromosome condensin MukBEF ATPase and DNA-binding subunit MukB
LQDVDMMKDRVQELEQAQGSVNEVQKGLEQLKLVVGNVSQQVQQDQAAVREVMIKVDELKDNQISLEDIKQAIDQI